MHKLSDNMLVDKALATTPLQDFAATSAYYDMREFDRATFVVDLIEQAGHPGVTIELKAAEDSVGTNAEVIKTGAPGVLAADGVAVMETKAEDLPEGKSWVAVTVTETEGDPNNLEATVIAALHAPHHAFENKIGADFLYNSWE